MIHKLFLAALLLLLVFFMNIASTQQAVYDVLDYGAKADGHTKITEAVRAAIENATENGGGIVYFPAGNYLSGPIHLRSNITLNISADAVIKFSDDFDDYLPMVNKVRWEGTVVTNFSPLIYANGVDNIGIIGGGLLDGNGLKWWQYYRNLSADASQHNGTWNTSSKWQQEFLRVNANLTDLPDDATQLKQGFLRPQFIQFIDSTNILIKGIKLINSPFWTITPAFCDNITVIGVTIVNPSTGPNTDGIDPDSCRNVLITECSIDVGDDCVCIKSGKDKQGRRYNRPSENITITNSRMFRGHGGIVIGSEMSGGVRNIYARNLYFEGTDRGIRLKSTRGRGGVVENVWVDGVVMKNILQEGITVNTYYTRVAPEPVSERTPIFRDIHISNVTGNAKLAIQLLGLPEMPLRNVELDNINIVGQTDIVITDADNVTFVNVSSSTV